LKDREGKDQVLTEGKEVLSEKIKTTARHWQQ
jgi:hypothetical protein